MKLYYLPGACSLASHIVLREVGASFDLDRLDNATKKTATGADFLAINPKGFVPVLRLDSGEVLTEGAAILQYIADQHPKAGLAPEAGSLARTRLQEHLNYTGMELHRSFGPLFNPASSDAEKTAAKANVTKKLDQVERMLADGRDYLLGDKFSVADVYLFVVVSWTGPCGIGLDSWPKIAAFCQRVGAREAVKAALKAEGLAA